MRPSVAHPGPQVETGLDRFGRVIDRRWDDAAGDALGRFQYAHDCRGNGLIEANGLQLPALVHAVGVNA